MSLALALLALLGLGWLFVRPPRAIGDAPRLRPAPDPAALPGATPDQAWVVSSPAVIESAASQDPCQACNARVHCEHHRVESHGGQRYRVADLKCPHCSFERVIYFVLQS